MDQITVAGDNATQTYVGTTFAWSDTEYLYVQADGVSKKDFVWMDELYVWTNDKIIDAEKDSETLENYYLYYGSCWAAAAANIFVNAGWAEGIFADEDVTLKYFIDNLSKSTDPSGYSIVDGGFTACAVEYLLGGYYEYWDTELSGLTHPERQSSGGFYQADTRGKMSDYLTAYVRIRGEEPPYGKYTPETGDYDEFTSTSQPPESAWMDQAVAELKNGGSVGMAVVFYSSDYSIKGGGHALTVYGFTYDESKAGTPYYYTGVIVADSDDNKGSPEEPNGYPASQSPDRMKILDLEYDESQKLYILPTYDSYIDNVRYHGVLQGFDYLHKRPEDLSCTLISEVIFAKDSDWNAAYSVSASRENALLGSKGVITDDDNVYIAVNLRNAGVGQSNSFTITATIDGDSENALTFNIDKVLSYGESDSQTVIDLGKLTQGTHNVSLVVTDGTCTSSQDIDQLYIAEASEAANQIIVNSGETDNNTTIPAGYSMIVKSGGSAVGTVIAADGMMSVEKGGSATCTEISADGFLIANGTVNSATVKADGTLYAEQGSTVKNTTIESDGWMEINYQGHAENSTVYGALVVTNGTADTTTVYANGTLAVGSNGIANETKIQSNGEQYVTEGGLAVNNTFDGGRQDISDGGVAKNNTLNNQSRQDISDGGIADKTTLNDGSIQSLRQALAYNTTINADSIAYVYDSGISIDCTVAAGGKIILGESDTAQQIGTGVVENLTVKSGGQAVLGEGSVLYGTNRIAGSLTVQGNVTGDTLDLQDAAPVMVFDFSERSAGADCMVNNISLISDLSYHVVFDDAQSNGTYKLTDNGGADFNEAIRVYDNEGVFFGTLTRDGMVLMDDQIVTLESSSGALNFVVADSPYQDFEIPQVLVQTGESSCSWGRIARSSGYLIQFSRDDFETFITVKVSENALNLNNLPYDLQWRVKAQESNVWTSGENMKANAKNEDDLIYASKDWVFDVLFAKSHSKWEAGYCAQHLGTVGVWEGTKEQVMLVGKNKLGDIFEGSSDANILLLTDDACGDVLFVDDIYTAFPGTGAQQQSRIAQINEIRAGAGDDIIDMTSQRFVYDGSEMTIRGGNGNDVIWATGSGNELFGDAGNDNIIGASGNDVIVGGSGDDTMHGGGGDDLFAFGGNWGNDTVEQLDGGEVTLWFEAGSESNWDASALTYSDGTNSVKVSGISIDNITLIFGDDTSPLYDELAAAGCFDDAVSEKIFEDKNNGMLA